MDETSNRRGHHRDADFASCSEADFAKIARQPRQVRFSGRLKELAHLASVAVGMPC